jgi:hypothetical protein
MSKSVKNTKMIVFGGKIIFTADIHIRIEVARFNEYNQVFVRTKNKIIESGASLLIIGGDILEKGSLKICGNSEKLLRQLFDMSEFISIRIILGNHDRMKQAKNKPCKLEEFITKEYINKGKDVGIFREGHAEYKNIIFGITDFDSKKFYKIEENTSKFDFKISLYHGDKSFIKTEAKKAIENDEYDYVLMGDIHTRPTLNKNDRMFYAGSLIQQNFSELIDEHGIVQIDLYEKKIKFIPIENDYGFVNLKVIDYKKNEIQFPKNSRVKFNCDGTTFKEFLRVKYHVGTITNIIKEERTKFTYEEEKNISIPDNTIIPKKMRGLILLVAGIMGINENTITNISDFHTEVLNSIKKNPKSIIKPKPQKNIITTIEVKFNNTICYGKNNVLDLLRYPESVILLKGNNASGKTSIFDIIIFSYFGKSNRDTNSIRNSNENQATCSVEFDCYNVTSEINTRYLIKRIINKITKKKKDGSTIVTTDVITKFYKIVDGKCIDAVGSNDKNCIKEKIFIIVGSYKNWLATAFVLYRNNDNSLKAGATPNKKLVCELLGLDVSKVYHDKAGKILKKTIADIVYTKRQENELVKLCSDVSKDPKILEKKFDIEKINKNLRKYSISAEQIGKFLCNSIKHGNVPIASIFDFLSLNIDIDVDSLNELKEYIKYIEACKYHDEYVNLKKELAKLELKKHIQTLYRDITHIDGISFLLLKRKLPMIEKYMNDSLSVYGLSNIKIIYHKNDTIKHKDCSNNDSNSNDDDSNSNDDDSNSNDDDSNNNDDSNNDEMDPDQLREVKKNDYEIFFDGVEHDSINITSGCGLELMILHFTYRMALNKLSVVPKSSLCLVDEELSQWNKLQYNAMKKFIEFIGTQYKNVIIIGHNENLNKMIKEEQQISLDRTGKILGHFDNRDPKKIQKKTGSKSSSKSKSKKTKLTNNKIKSNKYSGSKTIKQTKPSKTKKSKTTKHNKKLKSKTIKPSEIDESNDTELIIVPRKSKILKI